MKTNPKVTDSRRRNAARERHRLDVLYEVTRRLATVDETDAMLTLIINEAARLLDVEASGLRLIEGDELVVRACTESAADLMSRTRLKIGESLSGLVLARGEPVMVADLVEDTRYDPAHRQAATAHGFHGFLAVPLRTDTAIIGVLNLYSKARRQFSEDDVRLASALADHASLAISKDRLLRKAQDRAAHLQALARLSQTVSSSLDTDQVLAAVARAAADLMAVPAVVVWVADETQRTLTARAFSDPALAADHPVTEIGFGDGVAGWAAAHRRVLDVPDLAADGRVGTADWVRHHGLRSGTFLPVIFQDTVLGVLALFAPDAQPRDDDARDLLDGFVAQAAVAIRNARLYEQVRAAHQRQERRARDLDHLTQMAEVLQACMTEDEAYALIAKVSGQLFAEDQGAIFVTSASRNLVEARSSWGGFPTTECGLFKPDDCWALRRGRIHGAGLTATSVPCEHLPRPVPAASLCVPLAAQGELLGVLYLGRHTAADGAATIDDERRQLAQTVAEQLGLAMGNLKLREMLRNQSIRDPLTGLFNRRYMEETLERELRRAERAQRPLCVAMLDLDHFKEFNDTFGHEAGDVLLTELGRFLRTAIRSGDVACRYGGEEFFLIMPELAAHDAERRFDEIRDAVKRLHVTYRGQSIPGVTVSAGIATFPEHGAAGDELIRIADAALYRAKGAGRDRLVMGTV
ncbi:MAG TPA: diguanylate cyclase [Candidatus Acidoferrum sp.]|nr:diguanylate cyclase [Candidatus Acidoferrum sp.]